MPQEQVRRPVAIVVDDDPFILMGVCDILEDAGFSCQDAPSGDDAKRILEELGDDVTLLFSDVDMPGQMDGFALARFTAARFPTIEIVIASGHVMVQPGDLPPKATFLQKPFSARVVRDHLRSKLPDKAKPPELKL